MTIYAGRTRALRLAMVASGLALLMAATGVPFARAAMGQGIDVYAQLKTYDLQNRTALVAIQQLIQEAKGDPAKDATIENGLLGVLEDSASTFGAKQAACKFLWEIGSRRCVPVLAKMLPDERYNDIARYGLERISDPAAGAALREAMGVCKGPSLIGVIDSVGDRADPEAIGALKALVKDANPLVAGAAINALGKIATPEAVATLRALEHRNIAAARALAASAAKLVGEGKRKDAERIYLSLSGPAAAREIRGAAIVGVASVDPPRGYRMALEAAKSNDAYMQRLGGHVMGTFADLRTTNEAIAAWKYLPAASKIALLATLAKRRESGAASLVVEAIASPDAELRMEGIHAASRVGHADAVEPLAKLAASDNTGERDAVRESLAMIPGRPAARAIARLAQEGKPEVRAALMGVLGELRTRRAVSILRSAASASDPVVATAALRSLGAFAGSTYLPALVRDLVSATSDDVRSEAQAAVITAVGRCSDHEASVAMVAAPIAGASAPAKVSLLQALAQLGGPRALAELKAATASADAEVKQAAVTSLAETWATPDAMPLLLDLAETSHDGSLDIVALRGYVRLIGQMDAGKSDEMVACVREALAIARRPEEKVLALSVLRNCRVPAAVEASARLLDDPALFSDAAETILYLAAPQKSDRGDLAAVKCAATRAALDRIVKLAKDPGLRERAEKLR